MLGVSGFGTCARCLGYFSSRYSRRNQPPLYAHVPAVAGPLSAQEKENALRVIALSSENARCFSQPASRGLGLRVCGLSEEGLNET